MSDDVVDPQGGGPYADAGLAYETKAGRASKRVRDDAGKSAAGRPKGAGNRRTKVFEDWYQDQGFTDPAVALGRFISLDPVQFRAWLAVHEPDKKRRAGLFEIIKEQHTAAMKLLPYLHSKKPLAIEVRDETLPAIYLDLGTNQLDERRALERQNALSLGDLVDGDGPDAVDNEINDLEDDAE